MLLIFLSLVLQTAGQQFQKTNPAVEASFPLAANGSWHVGGFCFGMGESVVGQLQVAVEWDGTTDLNDNGPVYFAGFDGRADRWGEASKMWDTATCAQKKNLATTVTRLDGSGNSHAFMIDLFQVHDIRDWHFAVLSCGDPEAGTLKLKVEATKGALSTFVGGAYFDTSSCPVERWAPAGAAPFWVLLFAMAAATGACCTLCALVTYQLKAKLTPKEAELQGVAGTVLGHSDATTGSTAATAAGGVDPGAKIPDETMQV
ncbi:unnamed protein product [Effrenium voratum]|nr:unnamed protein product [Effrenium voratum]|eukprot:CAMPEP_0181411828 /NCGR_PEP_ID=MMETSP1110-20121109/8095_1 /TAXON_ID=174948 /ORGANISM="Symbiodinium sp., Strain CCMP421" /LENGTH=258 /DNA_ID=CAMNT_0023534497 /DNA_START=61 /DNA_END=837 /DNA_ORIENTATION=+